MRVSAGAARLRASRARRFAWIAFCSIPVAFCGTSAQGTEGEWRWRFRERGNDTVSLLHTHTEADTDFLGELNLSCKKKSGSISAEVIMDERARFAIADMLAGNQPPSLSLIPDDKGTPSSIIEISYHELDGWRYSFGLSASSAAFDQFVKTGSLRFEVNGVVLSHEEKKGLAEAGRFQQAWRQ